jgi:nicotinamidase-related amidase
MNKTQETMSIALILIDIQNDYFPGGRMDCTIAKDACAP